MSNQRELDRCPAGSVTDCFEFNQTLRQRVRHNLELLYRVPSSDSALLPAAVAIVLTDDGDQPCFVLTRRSSSLQRHSGQYALPGGRRDDGEAIVDTALRELREELGLTVEPASVLGCLDDFPTRSGFSITPVVIWAGPDLVLDPDPGEVDAVFRIPLWDLAQPRIPRLEYVDDCPRPVLSAFFETLDDEVFAPTAAILFQFREVALYGRATRVAHFEQPRFAWK